MPGRSTFTATTCSPSARFRTALCTCAIDAAATGSEKLSNTASIGRADGRLDDRPRLGGGEGRQVVLHRAQRIGKLGTDHIGPRRKELPQLDVGGAEAAHGLRQAAPALDRREAALLQEPRQPDRALRPDGQVVDLEEAEEAGAGEHQPGAAQPHEIAHRYLTRAIPIPIPIEMEALVSVAHDLTQNPGSTFRDHASRSSSRNAAPRCRRKSSGS